MVQLYSEQKDALDKLRTGSILVGGVGSGKSITALAYFMNKVCKGDYSKRIPPLNPTNLYIITTARKRDTMEWSDECVKFCLTKDPHSSIGEIKVIIDSWNNIKKYSDVKNSFFIFDEQRVVGSGTWVKAFLKIAKSNRWILLSATPGDTWSDYIPVFIANGFYKNRTQFLRRHAIFDRFAKYPKIIRYVDTDILERYRDKILVKMDIHRNTIRHTLTIPARYNKDIYDLAFKDRWNPYLEEPIKDAGQLCHILRRIVNSDDSRLDIIKKLVAKHKRIIVFYNLNVELEALRSLCDDSEIEKDILCAEWNGHKHEPIPDSDRWLYFVQYTAGAEGWNCTDTDTIVFYSLNYSYKVMEQASGRIDRINTPYRDLYYYQIISPSSIDKAIIKSLQNKQNFNELAFLRT